MAVWDEQIVTHAEGRRIKALAEERSVALRRPKEMLTGGKERLDWADLSEFCREAVKDTAVLFVMAHGWPSGELGSNPRTGF